MKLAHKRTMDCDRHMKLANPVTNCFGMVLFPHGEIITECVKEALLEMGIYQVEVLVAETEAMCENTKNVCERRVEWCQVEVESACSSRQPDSY